jgi:HlyD family type I secretion membrane fusion protein
MPPFSTSAPAERPDSAPIAAPFGIAVRPMGIRRATATGWVLIVAFFGAFGVWATFAPLESAAVATGFIGVDTHTKTVQHLERGIIAAILVREGDEVVAGQPLVRLDDTQARAKLRQIRTRYYAALALGARLRAQRDGASHVTYPARLHDLATTKPDVADVIAGQDTIFRSEKDYLDNRKDILRQRTVELSSQIRGFQAQIKSEDTQLKLIAEEVKGVKDLYRKGLERKPRLLALERAAAEIGGQRAQNQAAIARTRQSIGETKLQVGDLERQQMNSVVKQLRDTQTEIDQLRAAETAAADVLARTVIRAPVSGTVVNLRKFTPGGVVGAGEPILDLVPRDDLLVIEARVRPDDIDVVHPGLDAQIRLTAFNQRYTPVFTATIREVSADRLTDTRTGRPYYQAKLRLDADQPALQRLKLRPGMPAEVMILTGKRSLLDYLLKPILDSVHRGMRE